MEKIWRGLRWRWALSARVWSPGVPGRSCAGRAEPSPATADFGQICQRRPLAGSWLKTSSRPRSKDSAAGSPGMGTRVDPALDPVAVEPLVHEVAVGPAGEHV